MGNPPFWLNGEISTPKSKVSEEHSRERGPAKPAALQALAAHPQAASIPEQNFDPRTGCIGKHKKMTRKWFLPELRPN
jgi:hypothetical protein